LFYHSPQKFQPERKWQYWLDGSETDFLNIWKFLKGSRKFPIGSGKMRDPGNEIGREIVLTIYNSSPVAFAILVELVVGSLGKLQFYE